MKINKSVNKPSIIVSIPLVWGIRNVINSGLLDLLKNEFTVFFAVPPSGVQDVIKIGISEENIIRLTIPNTTRLLRLAIFMLKKAHGRKKSTKSDKIFRDWYKQNQSETDIKRNVLFHILDPIVNTKNGFKLIEKIIQNQYSFQLKRDTKAKIKKIQPVAAFSTSYVSSWEWPLFNYLQDLHVPTATHILSFDNLTSRGYFPLGRFDHYYTWQQSMSDELRHYFGIKPEKIKITGTPQFDFHILPSFHWSRKKTNQELGIDPTKPYIVYCANHHKHTPGEPQLISFLINTLKELEEFKGFQWVIRIHPMDHFKRWESFNKENPNIIISHPWNREDNLSYWGTPSKDEIALLSNTLRYAVATVTVASTVALDSCVTNTPIICVGFHPNKDSAEDHYYHDVHFSHHYEPIVLSEAVSYVQNIEEFVEAMTMAVENPNKKIKAREVLKSQICGIVDGKSANRISEEFSGLVSQYKKEKPLYFE